ncbi:MAG TPA: hypothetical protein VN517_03765 [Terriglobales bacterium]|nr:hypothetical protein [Terriglobales bacterium]
MNLIFIAAMFMFQMTARMPSPSDVPPIMEEYGSLGTEVCDGGRCVWLEVDKLSRLDEGLYRRTRPTCADKTRFLMTSEDGKKHCIRIEALGGK